MKGLRLIHIVYGILILEFCFLFFFWCLGQAMSTPHVSLSWKEKSTIKKLEKSSNCKVILLYSPKYIDCRESGTNCEFLHSGDSEMFISFMKQGNMNFPYDTINNPDHEIYYCDSITRIHYAQSVAKIIYALSAYKNYYRTITINYRHEDTTNRYGGFTSSESPQKFVKMNIANNFSVDTAN